MKMIRTIVGAVFAGLCFAACAQWQWLDKDGRKVFSDLAPPADTPEKNILKRPGGPLLAAPPRPETTPEADAGAAKTSAPAAQASASKPNGQDKELEAKKQQAKDAEAAKRKAEEEKLSREKAENCNRAKQGKASYESGVRVSQTNAAGERTFMDDATRAQELKRLESIIASDCK